MKKGVVKSRVGVFHLDGYEEKHVQLSAHVCSSSAETLVVK